jgi:hypothetical protein
LERNARNHEIKCEGKLFFFFLFECVRKVSRVTGPLERGIEQGEGEMRGKGMRRCAFGR